MPFTDPEQARAYLSSLSAHTGRAGDTSSMHPQMVIRLANSIEQARKEGIPATLFSGYREGSATGSAFDMAGRSAHSYGLASDVGGLGSAGSPAAMRFFDIARSQGIYNPYGPQNGSEFNHYQLIPQEMKANDPLLAKLQAGKAQGVQQMWAAYTPDGATPGSAGGASPRGPDNRQIVFQALVKDAGLSPQQALGVLWSLGGESYSNLRTTAVNPNDPGGAIGIGQWTGGSGRRQQLEAYAASLGKPVTDINVQTAFLIHDITQGDYKNVLPLLKAAGSPADATRIWTTKYEVPHNAAAEAEARIAHGSRVGSLDAQGNFVPGSPAAPDSGGATPAPAAAGGGSTNAPIPHVPVITPEERAGQSIGATLGSLANTMSGGGGGGAISAATGGPETDSSADHPAIRNELALNAPGPPTPSATPPSLLPGAPSPLGAQLGMLALQPSPVTSPVSADSITSGAPSMTSMLGQVGPVGKGDSSLYITDPRATKSTPQTAGGLAGQRVF